MRPSRAQRFRKAPPANWRPAVGDEVWLSPQRGNIGSRAATGTVKLVNGAFVKVKAVYGGGCRVRKYIEGIFEIHELRPMRKRKGLRTVEL